MKREQKQFTLRMRVVFAIVVLVGFVLIANLFYIQIANGTAFRAQADGQYVVTTYSSFERGSILFQEREKTRITAAGQKTGYKVSVNPKEFRGDPETVYRQINEIVPLDQADFFGAAALHLL